MSNVQNQNCKVLEEILGGSNSDTVKTTLSGYIIFKMAFSFLKVLEKLFAINMSLLESITNGSVG